jgi:hypothetical protein
VTALERTGLVSGGLNEFDLLKKKP